MTAFPYKNAADYGFLPGNDAQSNTVALQNAVLGGGTVVVGVPGIYDMSGTVLLDSYTTIEFGNGTVVRRVAPPTGQCAYAFVNRGAYTRTYNTDITISGLHLLCNGNEAMGNASGLPLRDDGRENECDHIMGLRGHVSFFYCNNVVVRNFVCPDLLSISYAVQISTFENFVFENARVEGRKDGVHLGRGKKFAIRHCIFKTFDDPIALNAFDYTSSNPQLGWIEDGVIEDCYDLNQESTDGFFSRILGGSWCDWKEGMMVKHCDAVVNNGRIYRVLMDIDGKEYKSVTPPTHERGFKVLDGICWYMCQDDGAIYNCGCRNIHFKDIFLQKKREIAFAINFENNNWAHSCYPHSVMPVQEDIIFENIFFQNEIPILILAVSPINTIKLVNSVMKDSKILLNTLEDVEGLVYGNTDILLTGTTFKGSTSEALISCTGERTATVKITNSIAQSDYKPAVEGNVTVISSDIPLSKAE